VSGLSWAPPGLLTAGSSACLRDAPGSGSRRWAAGLSVSAPVRSPPGLGVTGALLSLRVCREHRPVAP
jgi:hypothetical protein